MAAHVHRLGQVYTWVIRQGQYMGYYATIYIYIYIFITCTDRNAEHCIRASIERFQ